MFQLSINLKMSPSQELFGTNLYALLCIFVRKDKVTFQLTITEYYVMGCHDDMVFFFRPGWPLAEEFRWTEAAMERTMKISTAVHGHVCHYNVVMFVITMWSCLSVQMSFDFLSKTNSFYLHG